MAIAFLILFLLSKFLSKCICVSVSHLNLPARGHDGECYLTQNAYGAMVLSCHLLPGIVSGPKISDPSSDCWEFEVCSYSRASKLTEQITYLWHPD